MIEDDSILRRAQQPLRVAYLETAAEITAGDRNRAYGPPVANYQHTADIFNSVTGRDLTATEAAMFMVCVKLARLRTSPTHSDSFIDAMAYLGIVAECAEAEN